MQNIFLLSFYLHFIFKGNLRSSLKSEKLFNLAVDLCNHHICCVFLSIVLCY